MTATPQPSTGEPRPVSDLVDALIGDLGLNLTDSQLAALTYGITTLIATAGNPTPAIALNLPALNRVEVIDNDGGRYTKWDVDTELSVQDAGRTLKLFLTSRNPDA